MLEPTAVKRVCGVMEQAQQLMSKMSIPLPLALFSHKGYPEAWRRTAEKKLKGAKVESLESKTPEGVTLKPLYTAADLERCEAVADPTQDAPGLFPFHRCVRLCFAHAISWCHSSLVGKV